MAPSIMYSVLQARRGQSLGAYVGDLNSLLKQLSPRAPELDEARICRVCGESWLLTAVDFNGNYAGDGRIVGMITLVAVEKLMGRTGRIEDVVVDREYRGLGISKRLLELAVQEARRRGMYKLELTSGPNRKSAAALYRKFGFEQKETNVYQLSLQEPR